MLCHYAAITPFRHFLAMPLLSIHFHLPLMTLSLPPIIFAMPLRRRRHDYATTPSRCFRYAMLTPRDFRHSIFADAFAFRRHYAFVFSVRHYY